MNQYTKKKEPQEKVMGVPHNRTKKKDWPAMEGWLEGSRNSE